jgi:hypothetical protein
MQTELQTEYPQYDIHILSINQIGYGSGSGPALVGQVSSLPMVQDDNIEDIWNSWHALAPNPSTHSGAPWRDVHILNEQNEIIETYSLTLNNLSNPQNYAVLKQMFVDAATP